MLFDFVRDRKVELSEIPLAPVCEAYFRYLVASGHADLDEAAAALIALAYLLERKAWQLLPTPEPIPELEEALELIAPTTHEYQVAIESLRLFHEERERLFFRAAEPDLSAYELPLDLGDVKPDDLARALSKLLSKATEHPEVAVHRARRSLSEMMRLVFSGMTKEFKPLPDLLPGPYSREEAVYWFLAILELVRLGQIGVKMQEEEVCFGRLK